MTHEENCKKGTFRESERESDREGEIETERVGGEKAEDETGGL